MDEGDADADAGEKRGRAVLCESAERMGRRALHASHSAKRALDPTALKTSRKIRHAKLFSRRSSRSPAHRSHPHGHDGGCAAERCVLIPRHGRASPCAPVISPGTLPHRTMWRNGACAMPVPAAEKFRAEILRTCPRSLLHRHCTAHSNAPVSINFCACAIVPRAGSSGRGG